MAMAFHPFAERRRARRNGVVPAASATPRAAERQDDDPEPARPAFLERIAPIGGGIRSFAVLLGCCAAALCVLLLGVIATSQIAKLVFAGLLNTLGRGIAS